jgi:hypothetical protein
MKNVLILGVFVGFAAFMNAQNLVPVTFQVDMSNELVSPEGVYVAGSFQGWDAGATPLSDVDMDNIYEVTVDVVPGFLEFKFLNGPAWDFVEDVPSACQVEISGNDNRFLQVDESDTEASMLVCFESCGACGLNSVRFRVDMSAEEVISPNGVHVAGEFQNWDPAATAMQDDNGDDVWETIASFDTTGMGDSFSFKFINGNSWTNPSENIEDESCSDSFGNRTIVLSSENEILFGDVTTGAAACYGACGSCVSPTEVTLRVDMTTQEAVSINGVHVAGSFQGWQPGNTALNDEDGDGIWEITLGMAPGEYEFKFINGNDWGGGGEGNIDNELIVGECAADGTDNRALSVGNDNLVYEVCYNSCALTCIENPDPADVTFRVDMSEEIVSSSGVWVIGNFTAPNWQPGALQMTDDDANGVYEITVNISGSALVLFKFVNGDPSSGENGIDYLEESGSLVDADGNELGNFETDGCGLANGLGAYNRLHNRSGNPEILESVCYNKCQTCVVNINEQLPRSIAVFPNPFADVLNVDLSEKIKAPGHITLRDLSGRLVISSPIASGAMKLQILTSDLPLGTYVMQLTGAMNFPAQLIVKQ